MWISMSESAENIDISPEPKTDFEENSPFQDVIILETYQRPDKSFFQEPHELEGLGQYRQASTEILT